MDDLLQLALLGTNARKAAGLPATTAAAEPIKQLAELSFERQILLAAGTQAVYEMAGVLSRSVDAPADAALAEKRPYLSFAAASMLRDLLPESHAQQDVLGDLLAQVNKHGRLLPPELLPAALGVTLTPLRRLLLPILGERGRWLARFRSEWSWALAANVDGEDVVPADADEQWEAVAASTPLMRREFLQRIWRLDPARVRQWIAESLPHEKADHRADLLEVLRTGFSADDLELLTSSCEDRSSQVRTMAARLSALIPDSAAAERARARVEPLVQFEPAGKGKSLAKRLRGQSATQSLGTLTVAPPQEFEATWTQDGIVEKAPRQLGARAWWLRQLVRLVPLSFWTERFSLTPEQLIELAADDEFGFPLIWGWSEAAWFAEDAAWLRPLWLHWAKAPDRKSTPFYIQTATELTKTLFDALPAEEAEDCTIAALQDAKLRTGTLSSEMLPRLRRPWSEALSRAYLQQVLPSIAQALGEKSPKHEPLHYTLPMGAAAIADACLAEAWDTAQTMPVGDNDNYHHRHLQESLVRFQQVIALRRRFRHELQP